MAVAAEVQSGKRQIFGIAPIVFTFQTSKTITGNASNITFEDMWKEDELASQSGIVVEALISSQRRRRLTMDFIPTGTSDATVRAEVDDLIGCSPNEVFTISSDIHSALNGTYNFKGGFKYTRTRDGAGACSLTFEQYQTAADGAVFAGLAAVAAS